jgi:hypothetical protein
MNNRHFSGLKGYREPRRSIPARPQVVAVDLSNRPAHTDHGDRFADPSGRVGESAIVADDVKIGGDVVPTYRISHHG